MAKAPANIMRKAGLLRRSPGYGLRSNARSRRSVVRPHPPVPCISKRRNHAACSQGLKERAVPARFSFLFVCEKSPWRNDGRGNPRSRHHQHVEHDDRRQGQDHRPDPDCPENVLGGKSRLFGNWIIFKIHNAPAFPVITGTSGTWSILKTRSRFRSHLTTG